MDLQPKSPKTKIAIAFLPSGLSGSKETAQDQVSVGMGLLAGSIVMLLTLLWGSCVVVGKCDLVDANAKDEVDTKGFSLTGSGVSTDIWTTYAARIMVLSVTPFVIVQLPQVLNTTAESRLFILTALILSIAFLISYCLYQVFQPKVQKRRLAFAKYKHVMSGILTYFRTRTLGRILSIDGRPDRDVIKKLFQSLDVNEDGHLSAEELRALIVGIRFDEVDVDKDDIDDAVKSIVKEFDKSDDSLIDEDEFANGISSWIYRAMRSAKYAKDQRPDSESPHLKFLSEFYQQTRKEHDLLGDSSDDDDRGIKNPKWNAFRAVRMLLSGTAAVCVLANPLVDAVNNFSSATKVPTFFVSFVVLPFASCSEGVSALIFIRNKKHKTASLTFSQIYGSVTMSNILSLSVFLGLVYVRELTWSFSSEVLVILIVCILMGTFASFRTTFPLWTCLVAFSLYPLSILLVYVLEYVVVLS
ncbi:sodium/calcium exchanger NCL-like isoform X2 [Rhododendron vialii]|uniref:sodium/calcium exchanger NCL-like isoform X2 n=1 Tax=Rhododendron vialii TaxID=182163 RepID=UPI00265F87DC|nr:sodium/calcium exchanger NCL-like isoform X2 [Rhododendron vialii]